jgi:hypothetical protein
MCTLADSFNPEYILLIVSKKMLPRIRPLKASHDIYVVDRAQVTKSFTNELQKDTTSLQSNKKFLSWHREQRNILFITILAIRIFFNLQKTYRQLLCLLNEKEITSVICYSDRNLDYPESALLKVAKKIRVPIILPYLAQYNADISRESRLRDEPSLQTNKLSKTTRVCFSQIIKLGQYNGVLFQHLEILIAHYFFGTLSKNVWWSGCGLADIVCVDNKRTANTYKINGCPENKIKVVGHIDYGFIRQSKADRQNLRTYFLHKKKTPSNKKIITLSMPQFYEQGYLSWEKHLSIVGQIFDSIPYKKALLLVSLHPRQSSNDYEGFLDKYEHILLNKPLSNIIGATDILLASNSTVLIWGGQCEIWTIGTWCPLDFLYSDLDFIEYIPEFDHLNARLNEICDMGDNVMPVLNKKDRDNLSLGELTDTHFIDLITK